MRVKSILPVSQLLQRILLSLLGFVASRDMREQVCLTVASTSCPEHIYAEVSQTLSEQIEEPASPANAVVPFLQVCQALSGAFDTAVSGDCLQRCWSCVFGLHLG